MCFANKTEMITPAIMKLYQKYLERLAHMPDSVCKQQGDNVCIQH